MRLTQIIEALLFASDAPLSAADLSRVDERLDEDTVEAVIQELRAEYEQGERSFQIYEVAGGYQLLTRPEFVTVLERYDSVPQPSRLSAPALEVLAIIAYRQPIGRVEIEDIRGVGSSGVLRTLTERGLVEPVARGEGLGRPLLYGTTRKFLEHFGFRSLEDLPRPDELPIVLRERQPTEPAAADAGAAAADGGEAGVNGEARAGGEAGVSGDAVVSGEAGGPTAETADGAPAEPSDASVAAEARDDGAPAEAEFAAHRPEAGSAGAHAPADADLAAADLADADLADADLADADLAAADLADADLADADLADAESAADEPAGAANAEAEAEVREGVRG